MAAAEVWGCHLPFDDSPISDVRIAIGPIEATDFLAGDFAVCLVPKAGRIGNRLANCPKKGYNRIWLFAQGAYFVYAGRAAPHQQSEVYAV